MKWGNDSGLVYYVAHLVSKVYLINSITLPEARRSEV